MMSPFRLGNFIARCDVETITPRVFNDVHPIKTLKEVSVSIRMYWTSNVLDKSPIPKVVLSSTAPWVWTCPPAKPIKGSRWGFIIFGEMSNLLKMEKKAISVELPLSITTFLTSQLVIVVTSHFS